MPHVVPTLIYLAQIYSYYIRGDRSPLKFRCKINIFGHSPNIIKEDLLFVKAEIFIVNKPFRGLVKNPKIREKLGLARPHPPTSLSIFFKHVQQQKTAQKKTKKKTQNFKKKKRIRVGA